MLNQKLIEEVSARLKDAFSQSPGADIEKNMRAVLQSVFAKLDLVTREEFDVQQAVLLRTREKLTQLEAQVAALEKSREAKAP
ncbi:MAG: accessory factor UbiK family protein [Burkholderiales bacterium]